MTRTLLVVSLFLCGCSPSPCLNPDECVSTNVETLSCDVRWADGGVAADVAARCTGPEDAGATTDASGRFQLSISVSRGGFAGWSDACDQLAFSDGQGPLTARDGGVSARQLNGGQVTSGCLVVLE